MAEDQTFDAPQSDAHVFEFRRHVTLERQKALESWRQWIFEKVAKEEITPVEAEMFAANSGLSSLEGQYWPAAMDDSYWPLAFTVIWISWRDQTRVANQWDRFRTWAGHIWRDPHDGAQVESLQDAEAQLWRTLASGSVKAIGMPNRETDYVEIPSFQWRNLVWVPGTGKMSVRNFAQIDARYSCVDVARADVLRVWPEIEIHAAKTADVPDQPIASSSSTAKRGRKPDPEVDRFWIEIVRATSSGRYENQRVLREHMDKWAGLNGCTYDSETIRKKVGALYREMGWREGSPE